jgi:4-amino-4-deoxy-L-arabinose transferase-like glycosyltransferase
MLTSTTPSVPNGAALLSSRDSSTAGSPRNLLPLIILLALTVRLIVAFFYVHELLDVDKFYEQFGWEVGWIARALASGRGFTSPFFPWSGPTALVPPLYTYLLSGVFRLFGIYTLTSGFVILSLNSLFSSLTCIPIYFSAKHSLGAQRARYAAWAWAFYPFAIYFSAHRVWEYALTALLFTTCFCIVQRIHRSTKLAAWFGFGALYGLTALSNPAVLSVLPFLLIFALWRTRQATGPWLLKGTVAILAVIAMLAPWTVRNYRVLGVLCPVRDNYWQDVYGGNVYNTVDATPPTSSLYPASNPDEMRMYYALGETAYLQSKHHLAVDLITQHPLAFVRTSLRRIVLYWTGYWSFRPYYIALEPTELPLMFYLLVVTSLMLRGALRLWRRNRSAAIPYLILIAIFPFTYYASNTKMDYREPIETAIVVLAVAGAAPLKRLHSGSVRTIAEQAKMTV